MNAMKWKMFFDTPIPVPCEVPLGSYYYDKFVNGFTIGFFLANYMMGCMFCRRCSYKDGEYSKLFPVGMQLLTSYMDVNVDFYNVQDPPEGFKLTRDDYITFSSTRLHSRSYGNSTAKQPNPMTIAKLLLKCIVGRRFWRNRYPYNYVSMTETQHIIELCSFMQWLPLPSHDECFKILMSLNSKFLTQNNENQ